MMWQALAIFEDTFSPDHPHVLIARGGIAHMLHLKGDLAKAAILYEEVLSTEKAKRGEQHIDVATTLHNLGGLRLAMNQAESALCLLSSAYQIKKEAYSGNHPEVLSTLYKLAETFQALARWTEAEEHFHAAWLGFKDLVGTDHPNALLALAGKGATALSQGRKTEGLAWLQQAQQKLQTQLGKSHPLCAQIGQIINQTENP
jgi:tetratricopeptide (TPR) repeat protein